MKIPTSNLYIDSFSVCARAFVCGAALVVGGCGGTNNDGGNLAAGAGGTQAQGGNATTAGAPAQNGGAPSGLAGSPGSGGTSQGGADTSGGGAAGGSTPTAGSGQGGTMGGAGAPPTGGAGGAGSGSNKVLIYAVTTGFRHGSITAGAMALTTAAAKFGLVTERVGDTNATNMPDATKFTKAALAGYGAVVLLANSGEPIGYPATQEIQNLYDYVHGGGALVAIEDASHCYDGGFNNHPADPLWVPLIGGDFSSHPGGVAPATCTTTGTSPTVMTLPAMFTTTDEIYSTKMPNPDNQVVLNCKSSKDTTVRPVSWVRNEGTGRVFYTALGHADVLWTAPMDAAAPNSRLVENHVLPGLLWAMKR